MAPTDMGLDDNCKACTEKLSWCAFVLRDYYATLGNRLKVMVLRHTNLILPHYFYEDMNFSETNF